ncbi:hypothetical protein EJ05DRAFT_354823 [Pseudovirgaria hyperparasitica]|uniref:Uncharacterized protein n=1 Tax=Pseudovirgaria hyperparasitica TaxID=470096 RepID=A0A6A6W7E0_9PEZI|nr:uncharacterized protein EJ05DRAFT_354823 [Pseudovirgaria hyperparasitica]KAF2758553.1 hypothetical protein EJ05DRAFT_354823 [Pseudovirgaria hyperparasitica]
MASSPLSPSVMDHNNPTDMAGLVSPLTPNTANNRTLSNSNPPFTPRSTTHYESDSEFGDSAQHIHTPEASEDGPHYDDLPPTYEQAQASVPSGNGSSLYRAPPAETRVQPDGDVGDLQRSFSLNRMVYDDSLPIPLSSNQNTHVSGRGNVSRDNIPVDDTAAGQQSNIAVNQLPSYGSVTSGVRNAQPAQQHRDPRENILEQALSFTLTEPDPDVQRAPELSRKIAIPPSSLVNGSTQFLRAYSKALNFHAINPEQFAAFIDGLNVICRLEGFSSENAAEFDNSECLLASYLAGANEGFFAPRGLKVRLSDLRSLLAALGMLNEERISQVLLSIRSFESDPKQKADVLNPSAEPLSFDVPEPGSQTIALHAQAAHLAPRRSNTVSARSVQESVPESTVYHSAQSELPATRSVQELPNPAIHSPVQNDVPHHVHSELPAEREPLELDAGPVPNSPSNHPHAPRPLEANPVRDTPESASGKNNQTLAAWGEDFGARIGKWGEQFGQDMAKKGEAFGQAAAQHAEELSRHLASSAESSAQGARRGYGNRWGPSMGGPFGRAPFGGPFGAVCRPGGPFGRSPFGGPFGTAPFGGSAGPYAGRGGAWGGGCRPYGNPWLARGAHHVSLAGPGGPHTRHSTNAQQTGIVDDNDNDNDDALSISSSSSSSSSSSASSSSSLETAQKEHLKRIASINARAATSQSKHIPTIQIEADRAHALAKAQKDLQKATTKHAKSVAKRDIHRQVRAMERDLHKQYRVRLHTAHRALVSGTAAADVELATGGGVRARGKGRRDIKAERRRWKEERKRIRDVYKASVKELKGWRKDMERELDRSMEKGVPVGMSASASVAGGLEVDEKAAARAMISEAEMANMPSERSNERSNVDVADEIWILVENLRD